MAGLGTTEIILILIVVLLLFGAKRLPDSARSLGRSLRIFKAETKGLRDDLDDKDPAETRSLPPVQSDATQPAAPAQPAQQPVQPVQPAQQPVDPTDQR